MPKSKRNKQIELSKTKKRGLEWKKGLFEEVRKCVDSYTNVFVFSVNDMRNSKMKNVRDQWKHSRFFIGKNKIMAMALGRFHEEEYKPNLHKVGQQIKGQRGLLFSNKPTEEVLSWFRSYSEGDYARSGNTATETVNLNEGPLTMFPHSLEPYLRQLGLPTSLVKGVVHLVKDHEVCKAGDTLSPENAKILKLLGYEMAEFHITLDCVWSQDGSFMQLTESVDIDSEKKKKTPKKTSLGAKAVDTNNSPDTNNQEEMEVESEDEEYSEKNSEEENEVPYILNSVSTPKEKLTSLKENVVSDLPEDITELKTDEALCFIDSKPVSPKEQQYPTASANGGRPSTRKTPKHKRESLPKTPDANTSQDSPVFRQLRNRSVKFSTKKIKK